MCLMLYIGTACELPLGSTPDLRVESVDASRAVVTRWFSHPAVRFVGAHTGCSCGFPSVIADTPLEFYEGMPLDSDTRAADLRSVAALLDLLRVAGTATDRIELYPVADGEESHPPRGRIDWQLEALAPDRFFFNERFMHVVHIGGRRDEPPPPHEASQRSARTPRHGVATPSRCFKNR
jgi:hypothetical protein